MGTHTKRGVASSSFFSSCDSLTKWSEQIRKSKMPLIKCGKKYCACAIVLKVKTEWEEKSVKQKKI